MIRLLVVVIIFISQSMSGMAGKKPDWVTQRPVDRMGFIGIGRSEKVDPDYVLSAKKQALNDLASEIKVDIRSESLLRMVEQNERVYSDLQSDIRMNTMESLERYELIDSWEDKHEYWVYYRLGKADYQNYMFERISKITAEGYNFWINGLKMQQQGNLINAIDLYNKGLTCIQPYVNETLKHPHGGDVVHVGVELYNSLLSAFRNIIITVEPSHLQMKSLTQAVETICVEVKQNDIPLRNINLKIRFKTGSGKLSSDKTTDTDGKLNLTIQQITSKDPYQEIDVALDMQDFSTIKTLFTEEALTLLRSNPPQNTVAIQVLQNEQKVYIRHQGKTNELLTKSVKNLLSNDYFTVVNDIESANILILIKCDFKKGGKVKGEMYDFNEYFTGVSIEVLNKTDSRSLISYSVNNHRSLSPVSASQNVAEKSAIRDLMKRIDREFKKKLENININN